MKAGKTSRTAQYMAFFRALETSRGNGERIFTDPYAFDFLDRDLKLAVKAYKFPIFRKYIDRKIFKRLPGGYSAGLARTKLIDELLEETIRNGVEQVIILGAGFDTRALRLKFLDAVPVIEIDHPDTSNFKLNIIRRMSGGLPPKIRYCQIDFNKQNLDELARQQKFDFDKPTTFIWEGVTNYLNRESIDKSFSFFTKFPTNSYVIFTYVDKDMLDNPGNYLGGEKILNDLKNIEEPWTFGFNSDELPAYLGKFNLLLLKDLGADEYRGMYIPHRTEKGYEFYRVAMAKNIGFH
jgi:methyltransferase (TIGR00027 family)